MAYKNKPYPIHFYGRVRGKCDGRLQNWPGIANERPKFLAMKRGVTPLTAGSATRAAPVQGVTQRPDALEGQRSGEPIHLLVALAANEPTDPRCH